MGRTGQDRKYPVGEEDIAEVVAMMTGIPTRRIAQSEGNKLVGMADELKQESSGRTSHRQDHQGYPAQPGGTERS